MENKTAARIQVRETLIALIEARNRFQTALLADHQLPAWVYQGDDHQSARQLAAQTALRLTYNPEQGAQETLKLTGLIGISSSTLSMGEHLNLSKASFKAAMQNYRKLFGASFEMTDLSSKELRDGLLGNMNIQHLHFVQCYRQLKLFPVAPERVGFSWAAGTHGSVRLSRQKAIEHLRSKFTPSAGLAEDIRLLEKLPETAEVVIRRPLAPHLRANLTWSDAIKEQRKKNPDIRKQWPGQINTPLPLFIQLAADESLPEFNRIRPWSPEMKQERLQRSDSCLIPLSNRPGSLLYHSK